MSQGSTKFIQQLSVDRCFLMSESKGSSWFIRLIHHVLQTFVSSALFNEVQVPCFSRSCWSSSLASQLKECMWLELLAPRAFCFHEKEYVAAGRVKQLLLLVAKHKPCYHRWLSWTIPVEMSSVFPIWNSGMCPEHPQVSSLYNLQVPVFRILQNALMKRLVTGWVQGSCTLETLFHQMLVQISLDLFTGIQHSPFAHL